MSYGKPFPGLRRLAAQPHHSGVLLADFRALAKEGKTNVAATFFLPGFAGIS